MTREQALALALVRRFLGEFIPGPLGSNFAVELAYAEQKIAEDQELGQWLDRIDRTEIWQDVLESPAFKRGVLHGISTALFEGQPLKIRYRKPDGTKTNATIHPLGLVKRDQALYLVATFFNFDDPRLLLVHRVEIAWPQPGQPRRIPSGFDLAAYLRNGFPLELDANPNLVDIKLLFEESAYASLIERPLCGTAIVVDAPTDGWFQVTGQVPNVMALRWWLLGFGERVRILEPPDLAKELQNALFDRLTGLLLRRATEEHLDRLLAAARRGAKPLALVYADVDHFKRVNDTDGHEAGDEVLREVARRLRAGCRNMDVVGRWGGEEFLLVWPDMGEKNALKAAERLRSAVAGTPIGARTVSISLGVRCVPSTAWAAISAADWTHFKQKLLSEADDALYQAKESGRNRACKWTKKTPRRGAKPPRPPV